MLLPISNAFGLPLLCDAKVGDSFQFERLGNVLR